MRLDFRNAGDRSRSLGVGSHEKEEFKLFSFPEEWWWGKGRRRSRTQRCAAQGVGVREGRGSTFSLKALGHFHRFAFQVGDPKFEEVISPQMADWMTKQNRYFQG